MMALEWTLARSLEEERAHALVQCLLILLQIVVGHVGKLEQGHSRFHERSRAHAYLNFYQLVAVSPVDILELAEISFNRLEVQSQGTEFAISVSTL